MFIDTHLHINNDTDVYKLLEEARANKVEKLIVASTNSEDLAYNIKLANKYKNIYIAVGYHPGETLNIKESDIELLKKTIKNDKVVAIGEIGLDYYWDKYHKNEQIELFERQLKIAEDNNLPVIIHCRDAIRDVVDILSRYNIKGMFHCFSGSYEMAVELIKMGFLLGVGGVITFKNSRLKDVIGKISLDNIVLETDSPYLSPEPVRGKENSPKNIAYVAEFLRDLKGISVAEIEAKTTANANKIFNLK